MDPKTFVRSDATQGVLFCNLDLQPTVDSDQWDIGQARLDQLVKEVEGLYCPCCNSFLRSRGVRRRVLASALSRAIVRLRSVSVLRDVGTERFKQDYLWVSSVPEGALKLDAEGEVFRQD